MIPLYDDGQRYPDRPDEPEEFFLRDYASWDECYDEIAATWPESDMFLVVQRKGVPARFVTRYDYGDEIDEGLWLALRQDDETRVALIGFCARYPCSVQSALDRYLGTYRSAEECTAALREKGLEPSAVDMLDWTDGRISVFRRDA